MSLNPAQLAAFKSTIKADILANPDLNGKTEAVVISLYNAASSPSFWCWRSAVSRVEIYNKTSPDGTTWDWTIYKGQSVTEQGAWVQMFMGDQADFSQVNLRGGIGKLFGAANAQTAHCLAMGRRIATRLEKLLAVGAGSVASPATFAFEGTISEQNVSDILNG